MALPPFQSTAASKSPSLPSHLDTCAGVSGTFRADDGAFGPFEATNIIQHSPYSPPGLPCGRNYLREATITPPGFAEDHIPHEYKTPRFEHGLRSDVIYGRRSLSDVPQDQSGAFRYGTKTGRRLFVWPEISPS